MLPEGLLLVRRADSFPSWRYGCPGSFSSHSVDAGQDLRWVSSRVSGGLCFVTRGGLGVLCDFPTRSCVHKPLIPGKMNTAASKDQSEPDLEEAGVTMDEEEIEDIGRLSEKEEDSDAFEIDLDEVYNIREETEDMGRLSEEEEDGASVEIDLDLVCNIRETQFIIIGRFLTVREYSLRGLFDVMRTSWRLAYDPDVKRLEGNRFIIEL